MVFGKFRTRSLVRGNVALIFAIAAPVFLVIIGAAVDLSRVSQAKGNLQAATDSGVLAAASNYEATKSATAIGDTVLEFLHANVSADAQLASPPTVDATDGICVVVHEPEPTYFMKIAGVDQVDVAVRSCAAIPLQTKIEISVVLDVSSSMIEQNRFAPMVSAVHEFIDTFGNNPAMARRTRIAIVPFSSRVSIGQSAQAMSWLRPFGTNPAVPARWLDPTSVYGTSYTLGTWVDGVTRDAYNATNYYWMGCIEPRSDVEVKETGNVSSYGLTDATPTESPFVAMDSNAGSSKSFCPPPITPLSNNFSSLHAIIDAMTSEGSTRLDAGVAAGWYTLSPRWNGVWPAVSAPAIAAPDVKKIMVFMTDGAMNTQYGKTAGKLDWRCEYMQSATSSSTCNNAAVADMLTICDAMKNSGIEVFTVSYSPDADTTNIRACATDNSHFFTADVAETSGTYIGNIYQTIAYTIRDTVLHLTH